MLYPRDAHSSSRPRILRRTRSCACEFRGMGIVHQDYFECARATMKLKVCSKLPCARLQCGAKFCLKVRLQRSKQEISSLSNALKSIFENEWCKTIVHLFRASRSTCVTTNLTGISFINNQRQTIKFRSMPLLFIFHSIDIKSVTCTLHSDEKNNHFRCKS
jgi:hypothetical protein